MRFSLSLSLAIFAIGFQLSGQTVTSKADSGPGTLRNVVASTSPGGTIQFSPNLSQNNQIIIELDSAIEIPHSLSLIGLSSAQGDSVIIQGPNSSNGLLHVVNPPNSPIDLVIRNLTFRNSTAIDSGASSALYAYGTISEITIQNSNFINCHTVSMKGNLSNLGGAIGIGSDSSGVVRILSSRFVHCSTEYAATASSLTYGGAAYMRDLNFVEIGSCYFKDNVTTGLGGAIRVNFVDSLSIHESSFIDNVVDGPANFNISGGGAVATQKCTWTEIVGCTFEGNQGILGQGAQGMYGGALLLGGLSNGSPPFDSLYLKDSYFESNISTEGGAIYSRSTVIFMENSTFYRNEADKIGTIAMINVGASTSPRLSLTIHHSTFAENVTNTTFNENIAFIHQADCEVVNSTFYSNDGAELNMSYGGNLTLKGSLLYGGIVQGSTVITNLGYNGVSSSQTPWAVATDITGFNSTDLDYSGLQTINNTVPCLLPGPSSILIDSGDSLDLSRTQSGGVIGIRDIGSAESGVVLNDTAVLCSNQYYWRGDTLTLPGIYVDSSLTQSTLTYHRLYLLENNVQAFQSGTELVASHNRSGATYTWIDCSTNDTVGTGARFIPTIDSGYFAVIMTFGGCSDTSDCVVFNDPTISISEPLQELPQIVIFPNPTSNYFEMTGLNQSAVQVEIYDLLGRRVQSGIFADGERMDVSTLKPGTYIVRITDDQIVVRRLIVR